MFEQYLYTYVRPFSIQYSQRENHIIRERIILFLQQIYINLTWLE